LAKASRESKGRREVAKRVSLQANFGEEKNAENNSLSSPASRNLSEPNRIDRQTENQEPRLLKEAGVLNFATFLNYFSPSVS